MASLEPVHVVGAPPTRLVNVLRASSVVPDVCVYDAPERSEKVPLVVAFPTVHPPPELLNSRLPNCEFPAVTKYPVVVPVIFTVPDACVNVSELTNDWRTSSTPDGRVVVPEKMRTDPVVVALVSFMVYVPPPVKRSCPRDDPPMRTAADDVAVSLSDED
jgi:hypothetical protein